MESPLQPQAQIPIEHLVATSTQIPAQFLNPKNQNYIRPPYKTQNNYYPANRQNQNINLNNLNYNQNQMQSTQQQDLNNNPYLTQRQYNEYPQPKLQRASSDLGLNTNISNIFSEESNPPNNSNNQNFILENNLNRNNININNNSINPENDLEENFQNEITNNRNPLR